MKTLLKLLVKNTNYKIIGNTDIEISGITYDSRKVKPSNIFVCIHGQHTDGEKFVEDAISKGAVAIVSDKQLNLSSQAEKVTQIIVQDTSIAMSLISARFFNYPSEKLTLIGVTGTNGKTTITYLLESIFNEAKTQSVVIGTINYRFGDEILTAETTTPQSSDLQYLCYRALKEKFKTVIMEVSSHSLIQNRVAEAEFDCAIFTNLTRDHLDFHKTFEDYFQAKLKLFKMLTERNNKSNEKFAIINIDDLYGERILQYIKQQNKSNVIPITYGFKNSTRKCDVYPTEIKSNSKETSFTVNVDPAPAEIEISTALIGKHNIYNILASVVCAFKFGIDPKIIKSAIEKVKFIPGRFEKINCGQEFTIVVDYAHTDDALRNVLLTIKDLNPNKIITVFGCGGDRDRTKRPLMGEVVTQLSDYVIITSDNPRSEDPQKIVLDIEVGIRRTGKDNYEIIIDRKEAIKRAVEIARENDFVLIAGKGHEACQIIGDQKIHFSDSEVVREILNGKCNSKRPH